MSAPASPRHPGGRPRGAEMPCGWGCGALLTARDMRTHFATCPNRPRPADVAFVHRHKAILKLRREVGWTECVTPHACAAEPQRQAAHGAIVRVDMCACGETRLTEVNGGSINYGPWE